MHYNCIWHTKPLYLSNFQIDTISNIEVIRQNVFKHARVMVIGVSCDLNKVLNRASYSVIFPQIFLIKSTIYELPYKNLYLYIFCRSKVFYFNQ